MNKSIQFTITIGAPVQLVFNTMLDPEQYRDWTCAFAEGSYFEGSWQQGEKIKFLSPSGEGMISEIAEHRPCEFISIRHLGMLMNGVEDTQSEAVRAWAPAYENYTFRAVGDCTELVINQDVPAEYEEYMAHAWPLALQRLRTLCEAAVKA